MSVFPSVVQHVRCDNPGPMTLSGTNTYVVDLSSAPTGPGVVVIDPGPVPEERWRRHLDAVVRAVGRTEGTVAVLLTHHHADHSGGVPDLVGLLERAGREVDVHGTGYGSFPSSFGPLEVLAAPGHTEDSVAFLLRSRSGNAGRAVLFSGDTVLGGSSSFIAHPDGNLTHYLRTLAGLAVVVEQADRAGSGITVLAPGHGEIGLSAAAVIEEYRLHRRERLEEVRRVLDDLGPAAGVDDVVNAVYADVGAELRPAVQAIVQAQMAHLIGGGVSARDAGDARRP